MPKNASARRAAVLVAAILMSLTAAAPPRAQTPRRQAVRLVTREVSLGRDHPGELKGTRTLSPDHRHVAFVAKVAGGEAVYVDGVAGKTYPMIANDPLSEAGVGSPIVFSRDGSRAAYVADLSTAGTAGQRRVVADGVEGPLFDYVWSGAPHFSDDGKRLSYTARRGGKWFVVVDGVESKSYERVSAPVFVGGGSGVAFEAARDGQRLFVAGGEEFAADDPRARGRFGVHDRGAREVVRDGKRFVVWEGGESGPYEEVGDLSVSSIARRVTFTAKRGGREFAVVDGAESKPYDRVGRIYVGAGGRRVLFVAQQGDKWLAVVDGVEGEKYSSVEVDYVTPFGPDGSRYAYKATREINEDSRESFVVADGKAGKSYDFVDQIAFSPDGAHILHLAYDTARRKTFFVRDGAEVASYDIVPGSFGFKFSPDGKRMFFRLGDLVEGKQVLVLDGRVFTYDAIRDAEFTPDGRRFVFKAQRGRAWVMVVDGVESQAYEPDGDEPGKIGWSRDGRLAFSKEGGRVAYVGRRGGKDFVVADGVAGARYDSIGNLAFTPDGRHVVYTARRGGKSLVVVGGVEGREYDGFPAADKYEREGRLNVEGGGRLSILARRGAELFRVEMEIVEG